MKKASPVFNELCGLCELLSYYIYTNHWLTWDVLQRLPGDTQNSLVNHPFFTFCIIKVFLIK